MFPAPVGGSVSEEGGGGWNVPVDIQVVLQSCARTEEVVTGSDDDGSPFLASGFRPRDAKRGRA
jgi:hypothetical protein